MKRILAFVLCLLMLLSVVSCGQTQPKTTEDSSQQTNEENTKKTEEKKTSENKKLKIEDTSMIEKLEAIPIATNDMSSDQLRKICVDYMRLACSFCYTPSETYKYTVESQNVDEVEEKGKLYAGLPYVTVGSGSLYRVKNYYNSETGELNVLPFVNNARIFGNACSGAVSTAWSRVINSVRYGYTQHMTQFNGYVNVGPYTYPNDFALFESNDRNNYDTKNVCKDNGEQVIYQSYAAAQEADGIVNPGHVRMVVEKPIVSYNADGTIDGEESYLIYCDQICYNTSDKYKRVQSDGTVYYVQGGVDIKVSFAKLFEDNYIPFTFKEFLGTDPVEKAEVTISGIAGKATIAHAELAAATVKSNYNISDIIFTLKDADGKVLIPKRYLRSRTFFVYEVNLADSINDVFSEALMHNLAKEGGILEVDVQLYNGELLNVYTGNLLPPQ